MADHTKNRINIIVLVVNTILQSCDRRKERSGTGGAYDDIRMEFADVLRCSFCVFEDVKVLKLFCAMHEIMREISQTVLSWDSGDQRCKSPKFIAFFQKEGIAANLCGCTGSFQSGSTAADNNYVAVFIYMFFLIYIALKNRWVYSTADRTVYTDTVSGTANVTGDTFAEVTLMTCGNLVYPCRVCNQTTAHTDQVCITVSQDTLSNLRVTDITHGDTWLVEFFS